MTNTTIALYAELGAAVAAVKERLPEDERFKLLDRLETAYLTLGSHHEDLLAEQIAVRLSGMAPALRAVYQHIEQRGAGHERVLHCCRLEAGT